MCYVPQFTISESGDVTWLYDRGETVLCFDRTHVAFGHGRLAPGGFEFFPAPGTHMPGGGFLLPFWGFSVARRRNFHVVELEATATGDTARFRVVVERDGGPIRSDWRMTVGYDNELSSYFYEVETTATVITEPDPESYNPYDFEFFDLYTDGMVDYKSISRCYVDGQHAPRPGPMWDYLLYQTAEAYDRSRHWIKAPLNRFVTSAQNNILVKRDGYIGFCDHPDGNPMVQLLGDTAATARMGLCNYFYDLHFQSDLCRVLRPPAKGFRATAHFRLVNFGPEKTREVLAQATLPGYSPDEYEAKRFPMLIEGGLNSFEEGVTIDAPDHSKIWRPFHGSLLDYDPGMTDVRQHNDETTQCLWDRGCGRTGTSSLHVTTTENAIGGWHLPFFERPLLTPGRRYRLSVHIRTEGMSGKGATLGYMLGLDQILRLQNEGDDDSGLRPVFADPWISGDSDWTEVSLVTPIVEDIRLTQVLEQEFFECLIHPVLWHEGSGRTWFDDFRIEPQPGTGDG